MTILLPALAVAFAAFCVWLMVRIVNRRERWAKWTLAAVVAVPVLYIASFGPACWISSRLGCGARALTAVYFPIVVILSDKQSPWKMDPSAHGSSTCGVPLRGSIFAYAGAFSPSGWDWIHYSKFTHEPGTRAVLTREWWSWEYHLVRDHSPAIEEQRRLRRRRDFEIDRRLGKAPDGRTSEMMELIQKESK